MKDISNKHIFICIDHDPFIQLFIDALLSKTNLEKDDLAIVVIQLEPSNSFNKLIDVEYIEYTDDIILDLVHAKSITFISLNNWNALILNKIVTQDNKIARKVNIFITDDEVNRWNNNFKINSFLKEDISQHISKEVIKALSYNLNFIMTDNLHHVVSKILNRDVNIVNASIIFDILFTDHSERLFQIVKSTTRDRKKILLGSKANSFGYIAIINILNSFYKSKLTDKYKFVCLNQGRNKFALYLYIFYMKIFKKTNLDLEFFPPTDALTYSSMLSSISYFILQNRGGASSARNYAKWGCGVLCVMKDSPNIKLFKDTFKIDLLSFKNFDEIPSKIKNSKHIDVQNNRMKIMDEESRSIDNLSKIYT